MSNEAAELLKKIQYATGLSLEEIASRIGYSRPYLNNVKLKGEGGKKIISTLKLKFASELKQVEKQTPAGVDIIELAGEVRVHDAFIQVLISQVDSLEAARSGDHASVVAERIMKAAKSVEKLRG